MRVPLLLFFALAAQAPAPPASRIAILVDTSEAAAPALAKIRAGVAAFADAVGPEHELLLASTGRRLQVRVQPTTDHAKVRSAAGGLTADNGPTPLVDALREIDERFMRKMTARHAVFVIITADGSESSVRTDKDAFKVWAEDLVRREATVHAIVLKVRGNGLPEAVADELARVTRGHFETISSGNPLPDRLKTLAQTLFGGEP